jgi:hypothetical protein
MGHKCLLFQTNSLGYFSQDLKHVIGVRWLANLNQICRHFPYKTWSLYEYLERGNSRGGDYWNFRKPREIQNTYGQLDSIRGIFIILLDLP